MEHRKKNSKQLLFLEGINKDTDEEKLINRLITKLEQLGFNIIGKEDDPVFKGGFIISNPKMDIRTPDKKRIKKTFLEKVKQSLARLKE